MTVQATPPLPDPVSGRVPPYTQVLEYDDATSQWVIKYDVVNTPSQSTTGQLASVQQSTAQQATEDSGLTTPITEFPDPVPGDSDTTPEPAPFPEEPLPFIPVQGGEGGGRRGEPDPGPGIARSPFSGTFYDGATGEVLSDFSQKALSFAFDSGISPVGALANLNTANHFASGLSFDVQKSIMDREKDDIMSMSIEDRANVYGKLNRAAQRAGVSTPAAIGSHSGVGLAGFGNINAGMPDNIGTGSEVGRAKDSTTPRGGAGPFSEQNKAAKAADAARAAASAKAADAREAGRNQDSNFGGSSGPTGPGGGAGPRGGTGRPGDGANTGRGGPTGPGGGAGPRGGTGRPGDGGGRGSGGSGSSGGSSGSGGQGQSPGGPGRGR